MHKNPNKVNVDLNSSTIRELYNGLAILNPNFASKRFREIQQLHAWDYGFWLKYLDMQQQALNLKPIFEKLNDRAEDNSFGIKLLNGLNDNERQTYYLQKIHETYQPVVNEIINFWQTYPTTIYGSQIFLHTMARTFFHNKISYEEHQQGRQIKKTLKHLANRDWIQVKTNLIVYPGWWN